MTREEFWKLMELVDQEALEDCDEEDALEPLLDVLSAKHESELIEFEEHLSQCLYALDGKRYFDEAGENDTSDSFLYARCFVVASGRSEYTAVLADPTRFPKSCDEWCESLLNAATDAWTVLTGREWEEWEFDATVSYETGSNKAQW